MEISDWLNPSNLPHYLRAGSLILAELTKFRRSKNQAEESTVGNGSSDTMFALPANVGEAGPFSLMLGDFDPLPRKGFYTPHYHLYEPISERLGSDKIVGTQSLPGYFESQKAAELYAGARIWVSGVPKAERCSSMECATDLERKLANGRL